MKIPDICEVHLDYSLFVVGIATLLVLAPPEMLERLADLYNVVTGTRFNCMFLLISTICLATSVILSLLLLLLRNVSSNSVVLLTCRRSNYIT